jgi:hypothetical protein
LPIIRLTNSGAPGMNAGSSVNTNPGVNARSHADPGLNANSGGTGTLNKPERPLRDVWHEVNGDPSPPC